MTSNLNQNLLFSWLNGKHKLPLLFQAFLRGNETPCSRYCIFIERNSSVCHPERFSLVKFHWYMAYSEFKHARKYSSPFFVVFFPLEENSEFFAVLVLRSSLFCSNISPFYTFKRKPDILNILLDYPIGFAPI